MKHAGFETCALHSYFFDFCVEGSSSLPQFWNMYKIGLDKNKRKLIVITELVVVMYNLMFFRPRYYLVSNKTGKRWPIGEQIVDKMKYKVKFLWGKNWHPRFGPVFNELVQCPKTGVPKGYFYNGVVLIVLLPL